MTLKDRILKVLQEEALSYDETEGTSAIFSDEFERVAERIARIAKRAVKKEVAR